MNDHSILLGMAPAAALAPKRDFTAKARTVRRNKPSAKRQIRVDARRFQIGTAAMELFESRGYHATAISDIAALAGISVGTVYQYAPDKEGVLKLVLLDILDAYAREIPKALQGVEDSLLALRAAIRSYCEVVAVRHRAGLLGYQEGKSLKRKHQKLMMKSELDTNSLIAGCIQRCMAAGFFKALNVELMTYRIIMIAHAWALKHWRLHQIATLEAYIEDNIDFVFSAALTIRGRRHYRKLGFDLRTT